MGIVFDQAFLYYSQVELKTCGCVGKMSYEKNTYGSSNYAFHEWIIIHFCTTDSVCFSLKPLSDNLFLRISEWGKGMDKKVRTIDVTGLPAKVVERLRIYCQLLSSDLKDKWLVSSNEKESDIFISDIQYLDHHNNSKYDTHRTVAFFSKHTTTEKDFKHHLYSPITSTQVIGLLNRLSESPAIKNLKMSTSGHTDEGAFKVSSAIKKFLQLNPFKKKKVESKSNKKSTERKKLLEAINPEACTIYKVVFLGNPGVGKTTAIKSASTQDIVETEVNPTDSVSLKKNKTTIGIDYGQYRMPNGSTLNLIGNPGQMRFGFMWDITSKNADAFVILVDMSHDDPLSELHFFLKLLEKKITKKTVVACALTHVDVTEHNISQTMRHIKDQFSDRLSVFRFDPRNAEHAENLVKYIGKKIITNDQSDYVPLTIKRAKKI